MPKDPGQPINQVNPKLLELHLQLQQEETEEVCGLVVLHNECDSEPPNEVLAQPNLPIQSTKSSAKLLTLPTHMDILLP